MSHGAILLYAAAVILGFVTISISVLGTIRSHIGTYWFLIGFYAFFTLDITVELIRDYLLLNQAYSSFQTIYATFAVGIPIDSIALLAAILYLHHSLEVKHLGSRNWAVLLVSAWAIGGYFVPGAVSVDVTKLIFRFNLSVLLAQMAYLLMLLYIVVVGFASLRRDRTRREQVLYSAFVLFGLIGFAETMFSVAALLKDPTFIIGRGDFSLSASAVAYVLFGLVMIYFFGAFLLNDARPAPEVADTFAARFGLSPREQEVVALLNRGMSNREIAEKLFVSLATIKTHVHNVYEKTGAASRFELFHLQGDSSG